MSIGVLYNGYPVLHKVTKFSGGELNPLLVWKGTKDPHVIVQANIKSSDDVMTLLLVTDAIRRHINPASMTLNMPYLPYARQDRVCNTGEALSVKVFANLINSMNYDKVEVSDCHSDVGVALINNCTNTPHEKLMTPRLRYQAVVSPDAGAYKKTLNFAKYHMINDVIEASKIRDVATGRIVRTTIHNEFLEAYASILVVDDICDGGRTFIELAKVIKQKGFKGMLDLHVTHGIFSKGKEELLAHYDNVEATYDWLED